jgi:hypothetical protein
LLAFSLQAVGCLEEPCPDIPKHAITVSVRDSSTDAPICNATVQFSKGDQAVPTERGNPPQCPYQTFGVAGSRSGAYVVRVSAPGYADSEPKRVVVPDEDCPDPSGVPVTVHLQPV